MGLRDSVDAVASALKLTPAELMTQLRSGKSLATIAQAQGVSTDALVKTLVAAAEKQLATAVQNKRITQAQADTVKSTLTQRMTDLVNGTLPKMRPGFGGPGHWGGPGTTPQTPGSTSGTPSGMTPGMTGSGQTNA